MIDLDDHELIEWETEDELYAKALFFAYRETVRWIQQIKADFATGTNGKPLTYDHREIVNKATLNGISQAVADMQPDKQPEAV